MPIPLAVVIAGIVVSAIGAGVSAYSAYQQGQAISQQSALNALIAKRNAELAAEKANLLKMSTELESEKFRKQAKLLKASQETLYAKSGVSMAGTPIVVMAETQRQADIDDIAIRYAGNTEVAIALAQKAQQEQASLLYKMQGSQARIAGTLNAGGSFLSGLGSVSSNAANTFGVK